MEDSLLSIIKYLFQKKNINNSDTSVDSFFENGVSFPQFIALIFDLDSIPKIKATPKTIFDKHINNQIALEYVFEKNEILKKMNLSYQTHNDKVNILYKILTHQCFKTNDKEVVTKFNEFQKNHNLNFNTKDQMVKLQSLLSLLNMVTNENSNVEEQIDKNSDIDLILTRRFEKANIPLVINKSALDHQNHDILLIQLELIFDVYPAQLIGQKAKEPEIPYVKERSINVNEIQIPEAEATNDNEIIIEEEEEVEESEQSNIEEKQENKINAKDKDEDIEQKKEEIDKENKDKKKNKDKEKDKKKDKEKKKDKDKEKDKKKDKEKKKDKKKDKEKDKKKDKKKEKKEKDRMFIKIDDQFEENKKMLQFLIVSRCKSMHVPYPAFIFENDSSDSDSSSD